MITLTTQRKVHVSNRIAVLAALVLALTSYVGLAHNTALDSEYTGHTTVAVNQQDGQSIDATVKKRKLSISLLLFRRG